MNEGYLNRLKLCEDRLTVMRSDMNKALNEFADTLTKVMTAHRMFQLYVDANLKELRDKAGLNGELLTDNLERKEEVPKPAGGVEL